MLSSGCSEVIGDFNAAEASDPQPCHNPHGPVIPFHAYLSRIHLFGRRYRLISRVSFVRVDLLIFPFSFALSPSFSLLCLLGDLQENHMQSFLFSLPPLFLSSYVHIRREMRPKIDIMRLPSDGQTGRLESRRLIGSAGGDVKPRYPAEFTEGRKSHHLSRDFPLVSPVNSKV